ncbi:hypothetical protein QC764_0098620 [Podospora pseudoanserina]|uniref:Uncharacterized protein n=1 Tax=Podospora pseudoanserina TaxID=2609844 RepID=A0ABR0HV88_9PEZI|nr:hypothetical protein QC764_0098620 [Podospora pseudoanserina]
MSTPISFKVFNKPATKRGMLQTKVTPIENPRIKAALRPPTVPHIPNIIPLPPIYPRQHLDTSNLY